MRLYRYDLCDYGESACTFLVCVVMAYTKVDSPLLIVDRVLTLVESAIKETMPSLGFALGVEQVYSYGSI